VGHGPARELASNDQELVELDTEQAARLDAALERIDRISAKFKAARDEERTSQTTKLWHRRCAEIDAHLRAMAKVLIGSHQLNLDIGSDGGGLKARPWMEEMGQTFERLWFKVEGTNVVATSGSRTIATTRVKDIDYAWVAQVVVDWVVGAAEQRR
jgi:hypothetical protein